MTNHQFETVSGSPVRGLPRPGAKGRIVLSPQDGANALRRGWGKKKKRRESKLLVFCLCSTCISDFEDGGMPGLEEFCCLAL